MDDRAILAVNEDCLLKGRVYDVRVLDDQKVIPGYVQQAMLEGGRIRLARYDGGGYWHVFTDEEMNDYARQLTIRNEAPKLVEDIDHAVRLDFGCGENPKEGFEGVDVNGTKAKHKIDLFKFPYPWADNSVDALHSSHFIEHIPNRNIEERDIRTVQDDLERHRWRELYLDQDMLHAFFDECYRILKPGCDLFIAVPNARSDDAFADPTHRRYINQSTFRYFKKSDREAMDLDHRKVRCDFEYRFVPIIPIELSARHPLVQARMFNHEWNTIFSWHVTMRKIVDEPKVLPRNV